MKYPKRSQYKHAKTPYRIRNWPVYEAGLRKRGDLTIWFSDDAIKSWRAPTSDRPGGQRIYANIAIEAALTIRRVFHLPLRLTEGFLRSLADMLEVEIPIPDHTTLCRRLKTLGELSFPSVANDQPIHLLIDSTGLRIHVGNLRKPPKRRTWRKLHLAVDANTGEIGTVGCIGGEESEHPLHPKTRAVPCGGNLDEAHFPDGPAQSVMRRWCMAPDFGRSHQGLACSNQWDRQQNRHMVIPLLCI